MTADIASEMRRLAAIFLPHAESLVRQWLPNGRREGNEWAALNPRRPEDRSIGSFKINLRTGEWADFASGDKGGDLISLRAYLNGNYGQTGAQISAAKDICAKMSISHNLDVTPDRKETRREKDARLEWHQTKVWEYQNALGETVFEVVRYDATEESGKRRKRFIQRHIKDGEVVNNVDGIEKVPLYLPDLLEAIGKDQTIVFVEGEKCVDALRKIGVPATTNPMGSGKWWPELTPWFKGSDLVIIPDNDVPGRKHAQTVAENLHGVARRVRILELPDLAEKEDVFDWVQAGGTAEVLYTLIEQRAIPWEVQPVHSVFAAIPWWDLDKPGPEHSWLIKGLLTQSERSMLAGPSQSGKSFLALDMALAVARGIPYWERRVKRGGVIYQAGEGGRGVKKRLKAYRLHHGINDGNVPFILMPTAIDLHSNDDHTQAFIEEGRRWAECIRARFDLPLELVVIDTLATATPGADENSGSDMSRVLDRCRRICEALKAHVMIVHHMNAKGDKPRGHSSIFANLDSVILVERDDDRLDAEGRHIRHAKIAKQKDGLDGEKWSFVLRGIEVGLDEDGDPETSCVVTPPDGRQPVIGNRSARARHYGRLNDRQEIAMRALEEAMRIHGVDAPRSLKLPFGTRVVEWQYWRAAWARLAFGSDEKEAQRAAERIGTSLLARRVIGKDGNYVWPVKEISNEGPPDPDIAAAFDCASPVEADDQSRDREAPSGAWGAMDT